jgi:hypothetical protein
MQIWYRCSSRQITPVAVARFTLYNVWLADMPARASMHSRSSSYESYCPTFEEAQQVILTELDATIAYNHRKIRCLQEDCARAEQRREQIRAMTAPVYNPPIPLPQDLSKLV